VSYRKHIAVFISTLALLAVFCVLAFGEPRSGKWRSLRNSYLAEHPTCEACGTKENLEVHHVLPFSKHPSRELDRTNLIALCRRDHFALGHDPDGPDGPLKPDWRKENPNVRADAERMRKKLNPGGTP
jgi:5-methylcytosine-specific restriction endonuclease McrA